MGGGVHRSRIGGLYWVGGWGGGLGYLYWGVHWDKAICSHTAIHSHTISKGAIILVITIPKEAFMLVIISVVYLGCSTYYLL